MEFAAYVPAAVRVQLADYLEGSDEDDGYVSLLSSTEARLEKVEQAIKDRTQGGEVEGLEGLRQKRANTVQFRDILASAVECLKRLAVDDRMQKAYAALTGEFSSDDQWRNFISSAWAAKVDYASCRERLKRATTLKNEIADASEELAKFLDEFSTIGINGPDEFYSVPALLRIADNDSSADVDKIDLLQW